MTVRRFPPRSVEGIGAVCVVRDPSSEALARLIITIGFRMEADGR